jgi:hypothetical protein
MVDIRRAARAGLGRFTAYNESHKAFFVKDVDIASPLRAAMHAPFRVSGMGDCHN